MDHHNHEQAKSYAQLVGRNDIRSQLGIHLKTQGEEPAVPPKNDPGDKTVEECSHRECPLRSRPFPRT